MKKEIKKAFLDFDKEEQWLNEQGQNGLMLLNYYNGTYEFEDVNPTKYLYKIEIPKKQNRSDYYEFLEELGITVVANYAGRVYLRKNENDGAFDLYTDLDNQIEQYKRRNIVFNSVALSQLGAGILLFINMILYTSRRDAPFWILLVFGSALIISSITFFILGEPIRKKIADLKSENKIRE